MTTTTLSVTTTTASNLTVPSGTVVTLTAAVSLGTGIVQQGRVDFCDASSKYCTDIHVLGTAQLTSAGNATFRFRPGIGTHSYKAVFAGTTTTAGSSSAASALAVTGLYPTTTSIALQGSAGSYTLTATVAGISNIPSTLAPTGTISFVDTNNANAVLATAPLGSGTAGLKFSNSSTSMLKQQANAAAVADFNGDGILDMAISDSNSGQTLLAILLGKGDGTFTPVATSPTVGLYPDSIAVADFNGDGIADMAITSVDDNLVTILLGVGDGTFSAAPQLHTLGTPQSITTADFNGDGNADLAVVNGNSILIFLGKGDGTFTSAPASLPTGMSPVTVAAGDFNGDGNVDLALVNNCGDVYPCNNNAGTVWIFLGKGDGTFIKVSASPSAGPGSAGLAVGDFNGDGVLDLAVTNYGGYTDNSLTILLGKGDGTFDLGVFYSVPGLNSKSVVVADFNGDGLADLAVGQFWHGFFGLLQGKGDGTFTAGTAFSANAQLGSGYIAAADFNGDGLADLVLPSQDGTVPVLLSQPGQTVTATASGVAPTGPGIHQVAASYTGDTKYSSSISATVALTAVLKPLQLSVATGTYSTVQSVTISESVPGSTIYYSVYGTTFNTNGFVPYTAPLPLANGGVEYLEAYATETGYQQSEYAYATYTLNFPVSATPKISLVSGYYATQQTVTISDSDASPKIYYTTNGTTPNINSNRYTGPIAISSSETLVAVALSDGHSYSAAASAQYVIGSSPLALIYSIAGNGIVGYTGEGGPASLAQINHASSIAKDAGGNVFFADSGSQLIRKIAAGSGFVTTVAGDGLYGNSGDGGLATSAEFGYLADILLDNGNLFISDTGFSVIRKVNLATGVISTYAGSPTSTLQGDGGPATAASIGYVVGIAVDSSHNLYIAGSGANSVRQVNAATGIINTIIGPGQYGFSGDGGPASGASFRGIYGLALDASGSLYIIDAGNEVIRKVTATGGLITSSSIISTVAGTPPAANGPTSGYSGDGGPATSAKLNQPKSVAFDGFGNFFINDQLNEVIRKVTVSSGIISTVAGNGVACGSSGDGGSAISASLCFPSGIAVDAAGDIYVADYTGRIREIVAAPAPPATQAAAPTFSVAAGNYAVPQSVTISDATPGTSIYVSVDGTTPTTSSSGFSLPLDVTGSVTLKAIAVGPGNLVSNAASATYTVTAFAPIITTVAGTGMSVFSAAGGPALSMTFASPRGVVIDKSNNLYVSDSLNNVIWKITASTGTASIFAGTGHATYSGDGGPATSATLNQPAGMALDSLGNLYVADSGNNVVRRIAAATGTISLYAGARLGYLGLLGDGGPATSANLQNPGTVAFDGQDNLYIADTSNYRIREVNATTGIIRTVAGNGTSILSGDGGSALSAGMSRPDSLAVDAAGNFYVGSSSGARVRKVTAATGVIQTVAGFKDIVGQTGDGGQATSAEINPTALVLDASGNLYISNSPGEIRKLNTSTGVISNVAGIGYPGYSGDDGAAAVAQIAHPNGSAFDASGNLYFADSLYRVRKVTFTEQTAASPVFSIASGTYNTVQNVALSSTTANATIYYTTDGSTPTPSSTVYSAPIEVSSSETINAFAAALDYNTSAVASVSYVLITPALSITSLSPAYTSAGGASFPLTVNGAGFTSASSIVWGSSALTTQIVNSTQVVASIPASDISSPGIISVVVQSPAPGGGTSGTLQFEIDTAGSSAPPSFSTTVVKVVAGSTANYSVTLPSSATSVSVKCLNLPSGATCSYSSSTGALTITTMPTTTPGTYLVTAVFTETLPGTALAFLFLPFLLSPIIRVRLRRRSRVSLIVLIAAVASLSLIAGCGSNAGSSAPPASHQVTSSSTVTLIVN